MDGEKKPLNAEFYGTHSKKMTIETGNEMDEIIASLQKSSFHVEDVKKSQRTKKSPLPFTTSTLQQEAAKTLNFSTQKTMRLAQGLYEGVAVKGRGTIGLITYLVPIPHVSVRKQRQQRRIILLRITGRNI